MANNWLDKYEQGGLVLKKKTKDNYGKQSNYNDAKASVGPDFVGLGYNTKGRDYSPAWGGQFQNGGFLQPNSSKLPEGYVIPYNTPSTELAMSIGGEKGEPAYLIPSFKGGKKLKDPIAEYKKTGEHLGGPFKTWQEAEKFGEMRHEYVEKGQDIPTPLKTWGDMAMGGSMLGAVGFMYARTQNPAPANGKYAKKTKASAQDGKVLSPDADDRSTLGFNTSDPAFQNVKSNAFVPFDKKDFEGIKQNMAGYMSSPLYMERLSKSIPDAENAKETQQRRLDNLLSIKLNPKTVSEGSHYDRNQHRVNLGATDFIDNAVISHEIAHGTVPNLTTTYGKQNIFGKAASVVGDLFQPYEQFSNSELEKINVPLSGKITAPNFDYMMARKEEHYKPQGTKASAKTAANETYGDLTGMRQLLLDNGVTTEFGQELTPELFKKATENKRVINSPAFKRMKLKFKDEDIIKMNNEVAMNDNKKDIPQAQLGIQLMPYLISSAASVAASIPTMEEVKKKAINVIKDSPKLRSALNSGLSYVANTDWGKKKLKNLANNIDPHGYGLGYERAAGKSPVERFYSAAILNKKEDSRKEMDSLLAAGKAYGTDSLRVDLMNQYAGLPQKYNTLKPSQYTPTMGDKNQKYFNSPILDKEVLNDIDVISRGNKVKPVFKTKQDLENFVANHLGGQKQDPKYPDDPTKRIPDKGKGSNYVSILSGLGDMTYGVGEDEKGHYLSYYDNWDLNPYAGTYSLPEDYYYTDINTTNDNLARSIIGNNKENNATKRIGTPTNVYNRIYFDKKTGKPKMKKGGIIKDDRGQWAHPGEVTEIGSNDITMQGVDYPVLGISDTGDTKMMQPGEDYKFDGEKVTEFPMKQNGGWLDKYKAQNGETVAPYGSLQGDLPEVVVTSSKPSKWGNMKFAPYDPSNQPTISQWNPKPGERESMAAAEQARKDEENSLYNNKHIKALRNSAFADWRPYALAGTIIALPAIGSALGLGSTSAALAAPLFNVGGAGVSTGQVLSTLFAAQAAKGYKDETYPLVAEAIKNPTSDNVINAVNSFGWNTLNALPFVAEAAPGAKAIANEIGSAVNASKETGVLSKAWNINPSAEKLIGKTLRQTFGDPAYESFLKHGPTTQPEVSEGSQMARWLKLNREASPVYNTGTGENMQIAGTTRFENNGLRIEEDYPFAYFSEGSPWYGPKGSARMAEALGVERRIVPKEGANLEFYPAGEASIVMNPEELTKETINSYAGRRRVLSPFGEAFNPEAFDVYKGKPHWWKGYQKEAPPLSGGSTTKGPKEQMGFPNPLDFIDEITPRLDPIKLLGVQGDIMDLSPLNLIPGYGKKLAGKNQTFRKFGNSIQDVIERQALSPKGGSKFRMGKDQIVKEGNWAARGEPNENYSGVFEATFDLNNPAANLSASGSPTRNGVLMMDKAGNRLPDIPLTEPGMSFNRRLPFSTRYVPIDKQKLINNEFQFATMAPRLQSLAEKYGLGLGAATLMGTGAVDTYNKYTIDPVIDMAKKLELEKLGLNFKASKDTSSKKKQNGGWLNKYK